MSGKRIEKLMVENIKMIKMIQMSPDGHFVMIKGNNGQGKTSLLQAIQMVLMGKKGFPKYPIREGEKSGKIVAKVGNIDIEMLVSYDKNGNLKFDTILREDGGTASKTPQRVLDRLFGQDVVSSFDPGNFYLADMNGKVKTLLGLIGVEELLKEIADERTRVFDLRTLVNRDITSNEGVVKKVLIPEDIPLKLVSMKVLNKKLKDGAATNRENETLRENLKRKAERFSNVGNLIEEAKTKIEETEIELKRLIDHFEELKEKKLDLAEEHEDLQEKVADLVDVDLTFLEDEAEGLEDLNEKIIKANKQRDIRDTAEVKLVVLRKQSEDYTSEIEVQDYRKITALKEATYPVAGLSVDDDCVRYNGRIITEECQSKRIEIAILIAAASVPKDGIRIIRVEQGSAFDEDNLAILHELANEQDLQLWIELIGEGKPGIGHLIQDGCLIEEVV